MEYVVLGILAGVLSGLMGIGGGIILVPAMVFALKLPMQSAIGTSLVALFIPLGALMGAYNYYQAGKIGTDNLKFGMLIALGLFVGAYFGSKLGLILPEKTLKVIFGVFLIGIGIKFCI